MKVVVLQRIIRLKFISKKNINNDINKIEQIINNLITIFNNNLANNIINTNEFNLYLNKLEDINSLFKQIPNPFSHFKKKGILLVRTKLIT